jgi:hypothetical protein
MMMGKVQGAVVDRLWLLCGAVDGTWRERRGVASDESSFGRALLDFFLKPDRPMSSICISHRRQNSVRPAGPAAPA